MSEKTIVGVEKPTLKYKSSFDNLFNNEIKTRFFENKNLDFSEEQQVSALPIIGDAAKKRGLTSEQIAELQEKSRKFDDTGRQFNEDKGIKMSFPKEEVNSMLFSVINGKPNDLFYEVRNNPEKYPMEYQLTEEALKEVKMQKTGNTFKEAGNGAMDAALILTPTPFGKAKAATSIGKAIKPIGSGVVKFATKYAKPFITKTVPSFVEKYGTKAVETVGDALNPGKYVDAIASRFGASTAYKGFSANTVPGILTNRLIASELGYQGYKDLRYNKNKNLNNYIEDVSLLSFPVADIISMIPSTYRGMQNMYNQGKRVYNLRNYINSLPFSYTGVRGDKVEYFEKVIRNEIPRTFNVWSSNSRNLGKYGYGLYGKVYKVRDLNRAKRMFNTPRINDYSKEADAFDWMSLPYKVNNTPNGLTITKSIGNPITLRGKRYITGLWGIMSSTDDTLYEVNKAGKYDGVIINDVTDGEYSKIDFLSGRPKYKIEPIVKESVYNSNASLLLSPDESAWKTAWNNRNNRGLINRMQLDKGYSPPNTFLSEYFGNYIKNMHYSPEYNFYKIHE